MAILALLKSREKWSAPGDPLWRRTFSRLSLRIGAAPFDFRRKLGMVREHNLLVPNVSDYPEIKCTMLCSPRNRSADHLPVIPSLYNSSDGGSASLDNAKSPPSRAMSVCATTRQDATTSAATGPIFIVGPPSEGGLSTFMAGQERSMPRACSSRVSWASCLCPRRRCDTGQARRACWSRCTWASMVVEPSAFSGDLHSLKNLGCCQPHTGCVIAQVQYAP